MTKAKEPENRDEKEQFVDKYHELIESNGGKEPSIEDVLDLIFNSQIYKDK